MIKKDTPILLVLSLALTGCGGGGGGGAGGGVVGDNSGNVRDNTSTPTIIQPVNQQTQSGVPTAHSMGYKGAGVTVAVVDTGVNAAHQQFGGRVLAGKGFTYRYIAEGGHFKGVDLIGHYSDPDNSYLTQVVETTTEDSSSSSYHGTHVAGIIASQDYGVAPDSTILPVKVFHENYYDSTDPSKSEFVSTYDGLLAGISYASNNARVINASISNQVALFKIGTGTSTTYEKMVSYLNGKDVGFVAAAGNDGVAVGVENFNQSQEVLSIDSRISDQVLNVVALDETGKIASYSNFPGSCADTTQTCDPTVMSQIQQTFIAAPGTNVISLSGADNTSTAEKFGTSQAAPAVSGAIAVLLSSWSSLTVKQAISILKSTADHSFSYYDPRYYGAGKLDVAAAMQPVGNLKSSTTTASIPFNVSTASIPSVYSGLINSSAFKNVAYFDDYNRNFNYDISSMFSVVSPTPINWTEQWANESLNQNYQTNAYFSGLTLTATLNPYQNSGNLLNSMSLVGKGFELKAGKYNALNAGLSFLNPEMSSFYGLNGENVRGESVGLNVDLTKSLSMFGGMNFDDSNSNNKQKAYSTYSQLGFGLHPFKDVTLGFGLEVHQENNQFMGMTGNGVLSISDANMSKLGVASINYRSGKSSLYGIVKYGALDNTKNNQYSYLTIQQANLGQSVLGVIHKLSKKSSFGLQAYSNLDLLNTKIKIHVPNGLDKNGNITFTNDTFNYAGSLVPNNLEVFYRFNDSGSQRLSWSANAIKTPTDAGIGLYLSKRW